MLALLVAAFVLLRKGGVGVLLACYYVVLLLGLQIVAALLAFSAAHFLGLSNGVALLLWPVVFLGSCLLHFRQLEA